MYENSHTYQCADFLTNSIDFDKRRLVFRLIKLFRKLTCGCKLQSVNNIFKDFVVWLLLAVCTQKEILWSHVTRVRNECTINDMAKYIVTLIILFLPCWRVIHLVLQKKQGYTTHPYVLILWGIEKSRTWQPINFLKEYITFMKWLLEARKVWGTRETQIG